MSRGKRIAWCAVLCIPLILAIVFAIFGNFKNETPEELTKVTITSSNGTSYEFADAETLSFYDALRSGATSVSEPVKSEDAVEFTVEYAGTTQKDAYTFVMSAGTPSNCLVRNAASEYSLLSKEKAVELMMRNEFADVYRAVSVPELIYSVGAESSPIRASSYVWNYKRVDGEFAQASDTPGVSAAKLLRFAQDGDFTAANGKQPDYLQLTATVNGEQVYTGAPKGLFSAVSYTKDTVLSIHMESKWYESESNESYGEAVYDFSMLFDIPATYKLIDTSLKQGEFTVIQVTDGNDDETITATADFMEKPMTAFPYGTKKFIFIPIRCDAQAGVQPIVLTSSNEIDEISLDFRVTDASFKSEQIGYHAKVIELNTSKSREEYASLLSELASKAVTDRMWSGKFVSPVEGGKVVSAFGTTMEYAGFDSERAKGVYVTAPSGTSVKASNNGVVAYAGSSDYLGNAVIVDHGLGVFSYYFNLGSVTCAVGDNVTQASILGTIGTSGVTPYTDTMLYANSLDGCFVNPVTQYQWGIELPEK